MLQMFQMLQKRMQHSVNIIQSNFQGNVATLKKKLNATRVKNWRQLQCLNVKDVSIIIDRNLCNIIKKYFSAIKGCVCCISMGYKRLQQSHQIPAPTLPPPAKQYLVSRSVSQICLHLAGYASDAFSNLIKPTMKKQ
jgi:hypothetical protein